MAPAELRIAPSSVPRIKVLHVGKYYPPHRGGIETHLESLCLALRSRVNCEVLVANESRTGRDELIDGIRVRRLGTFANLAGAPACPSMIAAISHSDADLVHVQWPNPAAFIALLASGYKGPLVVSWQSDVIRQKSLDRFFTPVTRRVLDRAARILVSSPDYAENSPIIRDYLPKVQFIPLAISTDRLRNADPASVRQIRDRYGDRIVLGVGRLVYYKGFEYLVHAMREVRGVLLIVGEGPLKRRLQEESRKYGLSDRVILLGAVTDIAPLYHACDVFVLPSIARSEAFGIVQLEAMACGKPIVNTSLDSGVNYVSPDSVTGISVAPQDSAALAGAINQLLDNPERRRRYGEAGLRRVQHEFSLDRMADRVYRTYEEVLARH